jgi:23S rRNA (pseudouridine1915-N3)-methyltransferase
MGISGAERKGRLEMKVRFVWVGKTKNKAMKEMIGEYLERIARFAPVEATTLRDWSASARGAKERVEKEGADILARTQTDPFVVVLSERGKQLDSRRFAQLIESHRTAGTKKVTFVIGGPEGVPVSVEKKADLLLALGEMTFTHEMARLLLTEQVYRAFTIINNLPYQK